MPSKIYSSNDTVSLRERKGRWSYTGMALIDEESEPEQEQNKREKEGKEGREDSDN
jgi:hypothetical protein